MSSFCDVGAANEKGQVENLVGFEERKPLSPLPEADSIEELNDYLRLRRDEYFEYVPINSA